MKAFLMHRDRDFDVARPERSNAPALAADLELELLFGVMADRDKMVFDVVRQATLKSLEDREAILYRQNILKDCLNHEALVRNIYAIAADAAERERTDYWSFTSKYPAARLRRGVDVLHMFLGALRKIRSIADANADEFQSVGCRRFFAMIARELSDEYFASVEDHLARLRFEGGVTITASLGKGNKGSSYVLRKAHRPRRGWMERLFSRPTGHSYDLHPRDETGARALSELRDRGIVLVANALAQSTSHILSFFRMLQTELAFYVGALNLHATLAKKGSPVCFPEPAGGTERVRSCEGLYDVSLALATDEPVVGNDLEADGKSLVLITGANRGGKSTFLRAIGLAQLMMQCGLFVPAESFRANLCAGVFTHYKREEDASMTSGKFDEELSRFSEIVDSMPPRALLLLNESFAATNEREGSEIARQIVSAIVQEGAVVFFVTHLYEFSRAWYGSNAKETLYLRAEREPDGRRTFRLIEAEPLPTSYGQDVYERIFGTS